MQIYQKQFFKELSSTLGTVLEEKRTLRGFDEQDYLQMKAERLNTYMKDCGLNACVVAVSGGLDSSITLGIAAYAKSLVNSPIQKIIALSIPCDTDGATNQDIANIKAKSVAEHFGIELTTVNIGNPVSFFVKELEQQTGLDSDQWARGQAVSYMRTSSIYTITSLLTANDYKSIVLGTTNRDEGAYIGYFGKASDGMVDVQLISDVHKSHLRKLADYLAIPHNIVSDSPTGDMYDGRLDEEVFGVPYDFVELYTYYLEQSSEEKIEFKKMLKDLCVIDEFNSMAINLENMHKYNGHKYLGASPAIHLDIIESRIQDGWHYNVYEGKTKECEQPSVGNHTNW